jgi:hypothetical protein
VADERSTRDGRLAPLPWSRPFEDPVPGLETLQDAADYILKLPKAEQEQPHWQAAIEALVMAAEGRGPMLHARVGMLKAMGFGKVKPVVVRKKRTKVWRILR